MPTQRETATPSSVRHRMVQRLAPDDYQAWLMAGAMEAVGFEVVSIVLEQRSPGPSHWHVFGRTPLCCGQAEYNEMMTAANEAYEYLCKHPSS